MHAEAWSQWYNGATQLEEKSRLGKGRHQCTLSCQITITVPPPPCFSIYISTSCTRAHLSLVQPLPDLTKIAGQASVKQPLPVADLAIFYHFVTTCLRAKGKYLSCHFLPVGVKLLPGIGTNSNLEVDIFIANLCLFSIF